MAKRSVLLANITDVDGTNLRLAHEKQVRDSRMPNKPKTLREQVNAAWRSFYDWKTEHQFLGRYSVDKLHQFDQYQSSASLWRCLGVIVLLSVIPTFGLIVGLHLIPLSPPENGVQDNISAFVRSAIGQAVLTVMWVFYMAHSQGLVKEYHRVKAITCSILFGGVIPEAFWGILSWLWKYPVPGGGLVKLVITLGCIIFLSRSSQPKESRAASRSRWRIATIVMTGYLIIVLFYLLLALAFARAPWGVQLALIVIQPPLRSLIKRQSWIHARKLNDLSTDVTLNIVDISSSMHQALCIQCTHNTQLAALIIIEELLLGLAVAHMYTTHTFIVDGCRTLQTAIKIVEGSLSLTLVIEEDETQKEELAHPNEIQATAVAETAATDIQTMKPAPIIPRLRRVSSDTVAINSRRPVQKLISSSSATDLRASKCFFRVIQKGHRVVSDPVTGKDKLQPILSPVQPPGQRNSLKSDDSSHEVQPLPQNGQQLLRVSSSIAVKNTSSTKQYQLLRRMTATTGGSARNSQSCELPLSPKNVQLLRRTASDTIPESRIEQEQPRRESGHRNSYGGNALESRLQSWSRDPTKVYCFTDLRPEASQSSKQRRPSQSRRSAAELPPLTDLHDPGGFGRWPPLRSSMSVFLTPRTLMKHGSKRLLDLGRSTGRQSGNTLSGIGDTRQMGSVVDVRKPSQVNIDGMLVVRKDQARILEQTLQLLFSCEVLVVAEFVKVLAPFLQGILLAALWNLPSAHYNILLRSLSKDEMVEKMAWCLCFSTCELPALAMVCITVYKKYGISPLHLLAFLLEQQYANFQTKLMSCFIIALAFATSVHQGMDWVSR